MGTFRPTLISGEGQGLEAESVSNGQGPSQSKPPTEGPMRTQKGGWQATVPAPHSRTGALHMGPRPVSLFILTSFVTNQQPRTE